MILSCNIFYFYDANRNSLLNLYFAGQPLPSLDEILYDKNLGNLTLGKPMHMLAIDRACNYTGNCRPTITL
jgi:hypothetical protein